MQTNDYWEKTVTFRIKSWLQSNINEEIKFQPEITHEEFTSRYQTKQNHIERKNKIALFVIDWFLDAPVGRDITNNIKLYYIP